MVALGKVNCQTNGSRHWSSHHRTRNISHDEEVVISLDIVWKCLPLCFGYITITIHRLNNVVWIKCSCVNLNIARLNSVHVARETLIIMACKCATVVRHRVRWNCLIVNVSPLISRHLDLSYVNVLTQCRERLTILSWRGVKRLNEAVCKCFGMLTWSIDGWHPLCKKRNLLMGLHALIVKHKLLFDELNHVCFNRRVKEHE